MKKALWETQTLRAGAKNLHHAADPLPGGAGWPKFSWRWSLPSPTDPVWWRSMHTISSYRGNNPTNTRRPPGRPHRQDR